MHFTRLEIRIQVSYCPSHCVDYTDKNMYAWNFFDIQMKKHFLLNIIFRNNKVTFNYQIYNTYIHKQMANQLSKNWNLLLKFLE